VRCVNKKSINTAFAQWLPIRWLSLMSCLVICMSLSANTYADTAAGVLADLSTPASIVVEIVSTQSVHDGSSLAMATLQSTDSVDAVLGFFRKQWDVTVGDTRPGFIESQIPGWQLISRLQGRFQIVVQVHQTTAGDTFGYLSAMDIRSRDSSTQHGLFSDLTPLSEHQSVDGVDTSTMRVYGSNLSVSGTHKHYRNKLVDEGWQVLADSAVTQGYVLIMSRNTSRLEVTFLRSQEFVSAVVVHEVTSG